MAAKNMNNKPQGPTANKWARAVQGNCYM